MRVKRLEIQGFKSFKDKTVIHFDHSITGIVGPNGCGKSNIVDAFFWVMGEQSYKHMRGSGSEDLIFNGSSKYSPLGLAEATLVMETDVVDTESAPAGATVQDVPVHLRSKEVSVTRRVYRSGEGEYFINGVQARLKDIQELFMDTGVGAKGYSVIEQGQIGKIVNAKPEDRRLLIEEAAGIAKYKARKKESLRKMEATQANLSRLNDVIQEIERSLNSLERQAQKARQYRKYKDELLDKEMTWGRRKASVIRQKLESLRKEREAMEQELVALRAELQISENSIETDRIEQLTDTKRAEELQAEVQKYSGELARQRSALELSRRRQGDLASQLEALGTERAELEQSISSERERLVSRERESQEAEQDFQQTAEKAQAMDEQVREIRQRTEAARRALEADKKELMGSIARSSELASRSASLSARMESAEAQVNRLKSQLESALLRVEAATQEAEKARASAQSVKLKREELHEERKEHSLRTQALEQDLRAREKERDEGGKRLTQLKSRLQSLEELAAAYEGFGEGPKAALEWAKSSGLSGDLKAVADLLNVTSGYEAAAEGWLENHMESLISSTALIAVEALDWVQKGKKGRSSIYVMEEGGAADSGALDVPSTDLRQLKPILESAGFEVMGELREFVKPNDQCGEAERHLVNGILSSVCVVRSFAPVTHFIPSGGLKKLSGWSLVSVDGKVLGTNGLLSGGEIGGNSSSASIMARKRAIADLGAQVQEVERVQAELEAVVQRARQAVEEGRARAQSLQSEIQQLDIEAAALDRDVHQMSRAQKEAENHAESLEQELRDAREDTEKAAADREQVEARAAELVGRRSELEARISEAEGVFAAREAEVRAQESTLQSWRVEEASLRERAMSLKREMESARSVVADRERRLGEVVRILERASKEREAHTGGDVEIEAGIEQLVRSLAKSQDELSLVKDRLEQSGAKVNAALARIKELHSEGDRKTSGSNQLALDNEKYSAELNHLIQNLEEKYGPGCLERPVTSPIQEEMSEPVVTAEMSAEEEQILGEEVERLRERIRRLGEVNVMAIEEFEELKKRYDHILGEKSDLERSVENLKEAIEHINKTSEERFRRAFEAIADRFERLFPIIFGGGQAKLSLVYPEGSTDILDAGVDILAQPPGKKIVNIGLLSGGEKALTAVSLIFAIFMVKPSPFCVLDEVDAPLDDANIGKFNALLKEMAAKSQFIIITHNKKTMELNDTLYGVTMEEPGVSKMVSIEMR